MTGYFGLSETNAEGCIKCFCSGVATICESSSIVTNTVNIYSLFKEIELTDETFIFSSMKRWMIGK